MIRWPNPWLPPINLWNAPMRTLAISQEARRHHLKSVIENFDEFGFSHRELIDEEGSTHRALTVNQVLSLALDLEASHIKLIHTGDMGRKIGLFVVLDNTPADMIVDFGASHKADMPIADHCINGGPHA